MTRVETENHRVVCPSRRVGCVQTVGNDIDYKREPEGLMSDSCN